MAERKILGPSSYFIYLFLLGVICLSTYCKGENHVAYDIDSSFHNPSNSFMVPNIVSHQRYRRDVSASATPQSNDSVTPNPADGSTGVESSTIVPSNDGSSSNGSSSSSANSTSSPDTQNDGTTNTPTTTPTTTPTSTINPFDNLPIIEDSKDYYVVRSNIRDFDSHWTELKTATRHVRLSKSHRLAAVIPLGFKFPFYGHLVDNITIATGGFIYMSPFLHQLLTATQYIAPLMANFDLSFSPDSNIYYLNMTDAMFVEWRNVVLQDQNNTGNFTFQVILNATGQITFVYKDVPISLNDISKRKHPVKVGLSDAYYNDTYDHASRMRKRTIYEYHRVSVDMATIRSKTVVVLQPLPTCNTLTDCTSCTEHKGVQFDCHWCNTIGRCSDGLDWYRQHWDRYGCRRTKNANPALCPRRPTPASPSRTTTPAAVSTSSTDFDTTSTTVKKTQETTPNVTTSTKTTATMPPTTSMEISTPSQSPTSTIKTTSPSTSSTTQQSSTSTSSSTMTPSDSTSSTTMTSSKSTSSTTMTSSKSTSSTTMTSSKSTSSTTMTSSKSTSSTTMTSSKSTSSTTMTSSKSTSGTTEKSSESTSGTTEKSSESTSGTTEKSSESTRPDSGGVALPVSDEGYGFCGNGKCGDGSSTPVAVIVIIILLIAGLLVGIGGWVFYAYTHPTSRSGMWLMEHRPSQMKAKIQFWKSSSDSGAAKYKMESDA